GVTSFPLPEIISEPLGTGVDACGPTASNLPSRITMTECSRRGLSWPGSSFAPTITLTPDEVGDAQEISRIARTTESVLIRRASPWIIRVGPEPVHREHAARVLRRIPLP